MRGYRAFALIGLLGGAAFAQVPPASPQSWEPYSPALLTRATGGDATAQFEMGEAYRTGNGVAPDREQAIAWYRRAAPRDTRAADQLGVLLFTKGERKEAIPLLQGAALRRNAYALYILGTARFNGDYVPKDLGRAYADMRIAAQTLPQAQRSLGLMEQYVTPIDRTRADQFAAITGGPEVGAPAAPAYATAAPPPRPKPAVPIATATPKLATAPQWSDVPLPPPSSAPLPDTAQPAVHTVDLPASQPAVTATLKPAPKPARPVVLKAAPKLASKPTTVANADDEDSAPPAKTTKAVAALAVSSGSWRVQLGAYASEERANAQWKTLSAKLPELAKFTKALSPAGTGSLVRLQATGIATRDQAAALCTAATAIKAPCIVLSP